jgi:hypothetical protein
MQMSTGPPIMYAPSALVSPAPAHGAPAPHCWSRWGTVSTPSMPPQTQKRARDNESRSRNGTPQPGSSHKRNQPEEEVKLVGALSSSGPITKCRVTHSSSTPLAQTSSRAPLPLRSLPLPKTTLLHQPVRILLLHSALPLAQFQDKLWCPSQFPHYYRQRFWFTVLLLLPQPQSLP